MVLVDSIKEAEEYHIIAPRSNDVDEVSVHDALRAREYAVGLNR